MSNTAFLDTNRKNNNANQIIRKNGKNCKRKQIIALGWMDSG